MGILKIGEEKKKEYFIALRYDDDGNIKMCVVDRHGDFVEGGNILMLRKTDLKSVLIQTCTRLILKVY